MVIEKLTTGQLCVLRALGEKGLPIELMDMFVARSGANAEEWVALRKAGYVHQRAQRWWLSDVGRKAYRVGKVGRFF